jgi:hypothetical protein
MAHPLYLSKIDDLKAAVIYSDGSTFTAHVSWVPHGGDHAIATSSFLLTLQRKPLGGTYATVYSVTSKPVKSSYDDAGLAVGTTYAYRVRYKCTACGVQSAWSDEATVSFVSDTATDALAIVEKVEEYPVPGGYLEKLGLKEEVEDGLVFIETFTDKLGLEEEVRHGSTAKTEYAYYVGTVDGHVNRFSFDSLSDDGVSIKTSWRSKKLDFADQDPRSFGRWKTVYNVRLTYVDRGVHVVVVFVSTDGGLTWETSSRSLGSDSETTKTADFYFIKTGKFFNFKVECSSTDSTFEWTGFEIEYESLGEYFDV